MKGEKNTGEVYALFFDLNELVGLPVKKFNTPDGDHTSFGGKVKPTRSLRSLALPSYGNPLALSHPLFSANFQVFSGRLI